MKEIREWWNNKSPKDKWKFKAGIAWFGGGFVILIAIVVIFFAPKINRFIEQASPSELIEVESWLNNQMTWMIVLVLGISLASIFVCAYVNRNNVEAGK